ncbi:uncharacterized protein TNIN_271721 [Trichonephila inaurata madagascariensis]|uniref:Uncharacterized protein n=1 Tax=Trichonephila inaurata madagascariensis TaxID=2747483 RepID=A0A8X6XXR4_9ARAC|nr:uncharacterized protein TNIN_271721 [Trichonephila inaurata madagascariensis]
MLKKSNVLHGTLTSEKLSEAERFWIQVEQEKFFPEELKSLKDNKIEKESPLYNYMPYLDENGLIRLRGRLEFCNFSIDEKHPLILPKNSWLTTLIVCREYNKVMHEGTASTLAQNFIPKHGLELHRQGKDYWKNIIERSPWWGGFYELLVRFVKESLRKILGKALLSFEEMTTILTEIEAVLNLRPLSYVYEENDEPRPLTPMHFLNFGQNQPTYPITHKNGNSSDECPTGIKMYKGKWARRTRVRNSSKLAVQNAARKTLQEALEEVITTQEENVDLETLNLSSISITALRELHTELTKNERSCKETTWKPRYLSLDGVNKMDFSKPQKKRKIETETDSEKEGEETDEDIYDIEDEKEFDHSEAGWLQEVLFAKMGEAANMLNMPAYTKCSKYSSREKIELLIYEEYLKQKMKCSINHEEKDLNLVHRGVNYNVSVADIVNHFIQPPVSEDNPMILSPNWTTLTGMDMLQSSDRSLRNTAKFVDHNKAYIGYLTGHTKNPPKCIKCCNAENTKTCKETFDVVVNAMKSSLIVTDEEMKQAAMVETRQSAVQVEDCCCDALANSANAVQLLTHRFISLFLWPYLLGTLNLTKKLEELVVTKRNPPKYKKIKNQSKGPPNNKGRKKSNIKNNIKEPVVKNNIKKPVENHFPPSTSTQSLRRSRRSCVLQRRSFTFCDTSSEDEIADDSDEDFIIHKI